MSRDQRWGGKADGLKRLQAMGFQVPRFEVITAAVAESHFAKLEPACVAFAQGDVDAGQQLQTHALNSPLANPGFLRHMAGKFHGRLVAVRSSAEAEDGRDHSFAGQLDSILSVDGGDTKALEQALRACWASAFSPRMATYLKQSAQPVTWPAVIIQEMISPSAAGVMFTANPLTGNTEEIVIHAVPGLADALVAGGVDGDQFHVHPSLPVYARAIGEKMSQRLPARGGVQTVALAEDARSKPCLSPAQLMVLRDAAAALRDASQTHMDIEFAFDGTSLVLLQARPAKLQTQDIGERTLWDNSNVVESYPGITLPLTFSFASMAYHHVYEQFGQKLGVDPATHRANQRLMRRYIGLIRGRIYYNLRTWYTSMLAFPGSAFSTGAMEAMMGVGETMTFHTLPSRRGDPNRRVSLRRFVPRALWRLIRYRRDVAHYLKTFDAHDERYRRLSLSGRSSHELMQLYEAIYRDIYPISFIPIMADVLAMLGHRRLEKACVAALGERGKVLANDLISGQGNLPSTAPLAAMRDFAERHRQDPAMQDLILSRPARETLQAVRQAESDAANALSTWLEAYLRAFGSRSYDELKLEAPTPDEDPSHILDQLRGYFATEGSGVDPAAARREAEATLSRHVSGWPRRRILRLRRLAERHIRNREAMRLCRARLFALLRRLFLALGDALTERGILAIRDDVFYLTLEDLQRHNEGRAPAGDLQALVASRKAEYVKFREEDLPDRFFTQGLPAESEIIPVAPEVDPDAQVLQGVGCCSGITEATVRVFVEPPEGEDLSGTILAAKRMDPGWTALFPSVSGLLMEKGSVLSHSAIVARELGIPTIVGIPKLAERIKDHERVRMDGQTGTVTRLTRASESGGEL